GNNGGDNGDSNENRNVNGGGDRPVARDGTHQDFMKQKVCALTWWNSHKRTIRTDAAYALSWRELMKLMTKVVTPPKWVAAEYGLEDVTS
ncbi:hypothetical protein Tco_0395822, partial [Tanacetum coccineum]